MFLKYFCGDLNILFGVLGGKNIDWMGDLGWFVEGFGLVGTG
jgi:hypothetical protein